MYLTCIISKLDIAIDPLSIWKHILSVCRSLLLAFLWQLKGTQWHIWVAIFYDMYLATEDMLGSTQGLQSSIISMCHSLSHWHNFSDFRIFFTSGLVIFFLFKINYIYYFIGKLLGETCESSDVCLPYNNSLCLYDVCECSEDFYDTGETECLFSKYSKRLVHELANVRDFFLFLIRLTNSYQKDWRINWAKWLMNFFIMPPFEKGGAYCFAHVGRSICMSVCRYPLTLCNW